MMSYPAARSFARQQRVFTLVLDGPAGLVVQCGDLASAQAAWNLARMLDLPDELVLVQDDFGDAYGPDGLRLPEPPLAPGEAQEALRACLDQLGLALVDADAPPKALRLFERLVQAVTPAAAVA